MPRLHFIVLVATFAFLSCSALAEEAEEPAEVEATATEEGEGTTEEEEAAPDLTEEEVLLARARVHFEHGLRLTRRSLWEAALVEFEESLRLFPTAVAAYNRALCLRRLYRYPETIRALEEYIERFADEIDDQRRTIVENMLIETRYLLTEVTIEVDQLDATILVDGEEVGTSPLSRPVLLLSGPHELEVRLEGFRRVRRTVVVMARHDVRERFQLEREARLGRLRVEANVDYSIVYVDGHEVGLIPYMGVLPEGNHRVEVRADGYHTVVQNVSIEAGEDRIATMTLTRRSGAHRAWFWSMAGLSAASLLATIGLGASAYVLHEDYDPALPDAQDRYDEGRSLVVATDIMLSVACVTAAAAFIMALFTECRRERAPRSSTDQSRH